ncbi:MAG: ABC transporter permease subunit [Lachnospiraceae bacterium]|nr:ABC transporter permease subunit [Lachnospiraceae bacterium]
MEHKKRPNLSGLAAAGFWLLVWQIAAMAANRNLLLPLPTVPKTVTALFRLLGRAAVWHAIGLTLLRVLAGFVCAILIGSVGAVLSWKNRLFQFLSDPMLHMIRTVPVAAVIILVFLWVPRQHIPAFISFLTVMPVIWSNVREGLRNIDPQLGEMARVFGMSGREQFRRVTLPQLEPFYLAAIRTGIGFAWKSGIAAEIICRTPLSIGNLLWQSKAAIAYDEVLAVTLLIMTLSTCFQQLTKPWTREGKR